MRLINGWKRLAGMAFCFLLLCQLTVTVYAAGELAVVETYTGESEATLYLRGVTGDLSDVDVQAGTTVCGSVACGRLSETGQPMKTLLMLDNSLSIPKADRGRIAKIMKNVISGRMESEEIAVAAFNEGIVYLADYTADDAKLLQAVDGITYQSSHTYLTDVLYELLTEYSKDSEDVFRRIIVISDGMDNKSIGYTKDELFALLREYPVPIYTIGVQTGKKGNNSQLENMFAISRATSTDSFLLGEVEDLLEIDQALGADREIVKLAVTPPDDLMDGSKKTLKATFASGETVSAEVAMPQKANQAGKAGEKAKDGDSEEDSEGSGKFVLILAVLCLLALAAIVAAVITIRQRKRSAEAGRERESAPARPNPSPSAQMAETEMLEDPHAGNGGDTVGLWDAQDSPSYQITLTDLSSPVRTFQAPLKGSVVVGRKQGMCDIAISYDMSVSGRHCEIRERNGKFYVQDLQSSNGTYVDGRRVLSEVEIASGSILKMGKTEFRLNAR